MIKKFKFFRNQNFGYNLSWTLSILFTMSFEKHFSLEPIANQWTKSSYREIVDLNTKSSPNLKKYLKKCIVSLFNIIPGGNFLLKKYSRYRTQKIMRSGLAQLNESIEIENLAKISCSDVSEYWTNHTVNSLPFKSKEESLQYLNWRSSEYPLFHELMNIWGSHNGEVVLDYGCGPGNDLVGFLTYTQAKQIIGVDISETALRLANHRLSLHDDQNLSRIRLIKIPEIVVSTPLPDNSVDYVYSEGVIHHTTNPIQVLQEINRVLKDDGCASIMVYNYNSLWMHLYVGYEMKVVQKKFLNMNSVEAFARTTDGENCPISRCYKPEEFLAFCEYAGFKGQFVGGYFSRDELEIYKKYGTKPVENTKLKDEHRMFLSDLTLDPKGYPMFQGKYAGVGGVYLLKKTPRHHHRKL